MTSSLLPTYNRVDLAFERGEGSWLISTRGERYLDLCAGIAVNALGHANPELVKVLNDQSQKLWHVSNLYTIPEQESLANSLVDLSFADRVFFTNSGTEACELAIKMARKYWHDLDQPERARIIGFDGSFHGRSSAGIAAAGSDKLTTGFGPLLPGFTHLPFGDIDGLTDALSHGDVAAVIIEPVQGEGGIRPVSDGELKAIRAACDATDTLLIFDEVQCGVGRTGKLFAHEFSGVTPDIMMVAKGIGGGFPLGAVLASEKAASGMTAGTHGSTYGGNPLACAVGSKVLHIVSDPAFLDEVSRKAGLFRQKLEGLVAAHPDVFEGVRGTGLMLGLVCKASNMDVLSACYDAALLCVPAGDNVLRLLPALNIEDEDISQAVSRLETAAKAVEGQS